MNTDTFSASIIQQQLAGRVDIDRWLIDGADAIVVVLGLDGKVIRINAFMEQFSGYVSSEVENRDWFETFLPDEQKQQIRQVLDSTVSGEATSGTINPIVTKSGEIRQVQWYNKILNDNNDEPFAVFVIGHDVTERVGVDAQPYLPFSECTLSNREKECLFALCQGMRNEQIADSLKIKPVTVEYHLANARKKLNAKTREQALAIALKMGCLSI